jgi:hypothetical protein
MTQSIGIIYLPILPNNSAPYHMALFYDKGDGSKPRVIEFSPENRCLGIGGELAGLWTDLWGRSSRVSEFGPLVGGERDWETEGTRPETNDNLRRRETIINGDDLSDAWAIIQGTADEANLSRYSYFPLRQNSNSFAAEALARAGLSLPKRVKVDPLVAPGSNRRLTIPQDGDTTAQPMSYEYTPGPDVAPPPLWTGLGGASPFAAVGRGMPQSYPGALPGAPSAPAERSGWLLNPTDQGGAAPNGSLQAPPSDRSALPVSSPQTPTDSDGYPTLWNGTPIPAALRPLAAWVMRTTPQSEAEAVAAIAPAAAPGLTPSAQASALGRQSRASLLPEELRPLARYFGLDEA